MRKLFLRELNIVNPTPGPSLPATPAIASAHACPSAHARDRDRRGDSQESSSRGNWSRKESSLPLKCEACARRRWPPFWQLADDSGGEWVQHEIALWPRDGWARGGGGRGRGGGSGNNWMIAEMKWKEEVTNEEERPDRRRWRFDKFRECVRLLHLLLLQGTLVFNLLLCFWVCCFSSFWHLLSSLAPPHPSFFLRTPPPRVLFWHSLLLPLLRVEDSLWWTDGLVTLLLLLSVCVQFSLFSDLFLFDNNYITAVMFECVS